MNESAVSLINVDGVVVVAIVENVRERSVSDPGTFTVGAKEESMINDKLSLGEVKSG